MFMSHGFARYLRSFFTCPNLLHNWVCLSTTGKTLLWLQRSGFSLLEVNCIVPMPHSPSASCWFKIQLKGLCFVSCQYPGPTFPRSPGSWPVSHCPKAVYLFYRTQPHPHSVSGGSSSLPGSAWHRLVVCLCLYPWHASQCLGPKGCVRERSSEGGRGKSH